MKYKLKDPMIGQKFGKWTVIEYVPGHKDKGRWYECICECGTVLIKCGTELRAGRSTQCKRCGYAELFNPDREIGKKYGSWTILEYIDTHKKSQRYKCRCRCGYERIQCASELRRGRNKECIFCHNRKNAQKLVKHGLSNTKIYKVWRAMLDRCDQPNNKAYKWYGIRGIKVCKRWHKFSNFIKDMGLPLVGLELDRINNDGNYCKGNCQWVTHKENMQNTRNCAKYKKAKQLKIENA